MKKYLSLFATVALVLTSMPTTGVFQPLAAALTDIPVASAVGTPQPMYSGIANVGFYNGQPHSVPVHVNFPATCPNPNVITQTVVDGILCGNGSGPTVCPNDPNTTSIDLRAYAENITTTGFDAFLSAMDGVWVGATSPAYPIAWQATCGSDPTVAAIQDGKMVSGIGYAGFYNGQANSVLGPISIPAACVSPSIVSQSYVGSVLCGNGAGPTICPNDPNTTSQALMSRATRSSVYLTANNGVWVGAVSPQFPVAYQAMCQNNIGGTEQVYGGSANVAWYNGNAQSTLGHVVMPPNCVNPTIVTQSKANSILCGNGAGPTLCPNDQQTTSTDLQSYATNVTSSGFDVFLNAMNGVWVGAVSPQYPVAYQITCHNTATSSSSSTPSGADLAGVITLPPQINRGDNLPESIGAKNVGSSTVANAIVTQTLPSGYVFNSGLSDSHCSAAGSVVTCNLSNIAPGQTITYPVYVRVADTQTCNTPVTLQDTATATSATDTNSANNSASASVLVTCSSVSSSSSSIPPSFQCSDGADNDFDGRIDSQDPGCHSDNNAGNPASYIPTDNDETDAAAPAADLKITHLLPPQLEPKSDPDVPEDITVTNVGTVTVPSAVVTETIPTGLTYSNTLSSPMCSSNGVTVTCSVPNLAPGQSFHFMIYLLAPPSTPCGSTITKTATVTTVTANDTNSSNNSATASSLVTCPANSPVFQCSDAFDNDHDGLTDIQDPGCHSDNNAANLASYVGTDNDETNAAVAPQCSDNLDNDGDGRIDSADAGCHSDGNPYNNASYVSTDNDESSPGNVQCNDGFDNDHDGVSDIADAGCHSDGNAANVASYVPSDNDETNAAANSCTVTGSTSGYEYAIIVNSNLTVDDLGGSGYRSNGIPMSCGAIPGWDNVMNSCFFGGAGTSCWSIGCLYRRPAAQPLQYVMTHWGNNTTPNSHQSCAQFGSTTPHGSNVSVPPPNYALKNFYCVVRDSSGTCESDLCLWEKAGTTGTTDLVLNGAGGPIYGTSQNCAATANPGNNFGLNSQICTLSIGGPCSNSVCLWDKTAQCSVPAAQCSDGADNDRDGLTDIQDPGCHSDNNAANAASYIPSDNDETNAVVVTPQCSDNLDNDGDGRVDSADAGCHSDGNPYNVASYVSTDNDESNPGNTQCNDGADNDHDGVADLADPGCHSDNNAANVASYVPSDNDETNAVAQVTCSNEVQQAVLVNSCSSPGGGGTCTTPFYKDVTFAHPYAVAPNVLVTINHISEGPACAGGATDAAVCYPSNITTTGFRLNCGGSPVSDGCGAGTNGYFTYARANWTAVDADPACHALSGHGIIPTNCPNNQGGLCASGTFSTPITFATPYSTVPNVLVAAEHVSTQSGCVGGSTDQIECFPSAISTTGFTLNCSGSPYQSCGTSEGFKSLATAGWLAVETNNQCKVQSAHLLATAECPSGIVNQTCATGFRKTVTFPQPYATVPQVIVSTELTTDSSGVSACARGASDAYKCEAINVTNTGFTAVCWGSPEGTGCGASYEGYTTSAKFGYLAIDSACSQGNVVTPTAQCADGIDNDGDGRVDSTDAGCHSDANPYNAASYVSTDADESSPGNAQCNDGVDNDADGLADLADPGCHSDGNVSNAASYVPSDNSESNVVAAAQCADGVDNDFDGKIDAVDPGCHTDGNAFNGASYDPNRNSEVDMSSPTADLTATLLLPPQINRGDNLPETLGVQNVGSTAVANAVITEAIPAGLTFNAGLTNPACSSNGVTVTCNVGTLTPGQSTSFLVYLTVSPSQTCRSSVAMQDVVTTFSAVDTNPGNNTSNLQSTLVTCPDGGTISSSSSSSSSMTSSSSSSSSVPSGADLAVSVMLPPQVNRGFNLPEQLTVRNTGTTTVPSATLSQPLPGDFLFSDVLSDPACHSNGTLLTCTVPALAPGQSVTFMTYLRVPLDYRCNSPFSKSVSVATTSAVDGNSSNDSSMATTLVTCLP